MSVTQQPKSLRLSQEEIDSIHAYLKEVQEDRLRLQREGKLPRYKMDSIVIFKTSDFELIKKVGERQAQRLMKELRDKLGKTEGQVVSVEEFCREYGLSELVVQQALISFEIKGMR